MKAKFDNILMPIAGMLIDESQRKHITFDAFSRTQLSIGSSRNGYQEYHKRKRYVKEALKEQYSALRKQGRYNGSVL